jgi:hypothetical protein
MNCVQFLRPPCTAWPNFKPLLIKDLNCAHKHSWVQYEYVSADKCAVIKVPDCRKHASD